MNKAKFNNLFASYMVDFVLASRGEYSASVAKAPRDFLGNPRYSVHRSVFTNLLLAAGVERKNLPNDKKLCKLVYAKLDRRKGFEGCYIFQSYNLTDTFTHQVDALWKWVSWEVASV